MFQPPCSLLQGPYNIYKEVKGVVQEGMGKICLEKNMYGTFFTIIMLRKLSCLDLCSVVLSKMLD